LLGTGAELANVMNEAALEAVRRNGSVVNTADIYNAMDRILQVRPVFCVCT
jgi:ATP-dependent Zn protease